MKRDKLRLVVILSVLSVVWGCGSVPKQGVMSIKTQPDGADVQVNQKTVGPSPVTIPDPNEDMEIVATKGVYTGRRTYKADTQKLPESKDGKASLSHDREITVTLNGQLEVAAFRIGEKEAEDDLDTTLEVLNRLKNPSNTIVIYDASGSMRWPLSYNDKTPRFEFAQKAITDFIKKANEEDFFGLVLFGSRLPSGPERSKQRALSCGEIESAVPLQKLDKQHMINSIARLRLKDHKGDTPIEQALRFAGDRLKDRPGDRKIVLVTDGDDECGGEADRGAREVAKKGVKVYTLAFGIGVNKDGRLREDHAAQIRQVLRDCANAGGGLFFDTKGADDLYRAMVKVELDFFGYTVFDRNGKEVLKGKLGQKFFLDPGEYTVAFHTQKPFQRNVEIKPAQKTKVFIAVSGDRKPEIRSVIE